LENVLVTGFCGGYLCSMNINELKPDGRNYNKGTDEGAKMLRKSLKKLGAGRSVLIDANGNVVAGNKTLEAAKAAGIDEVVVIKTNGRQLVAVQRTDLDLNSEQGREMALADNATAKANIAWDFAALETDGWGADDLEGWGVEWEASQATATEVFEDDFQVPEVEEIKTDIVTGDLFEIGPHRLLCGDSTKAEDVERLMGGEKAAVLICDPPYGIGLRYVGVMANNTNGSISGDEKPFDPKCITFFEGAAMYLFGADYYIEKLPNRRNLCVWAKAHTEKENLVFGASFETFWRSHKAKREIWFENRIGNLAENEHRHPTQKPISLISRCILDAGKDGIVADNFSGSGTTMVAAQQLNRRCFGMEIDPKYCQVILDRMRKIDTNLVIKKNGQPYNNNVVTT